MAVIAFRGHVSHYKITLLKLPVVPGTFFFVKSRQGKTELVANFPVTRQNCLITNRIVFYINYTKISFSFGFRTF